MTIIVDAPRVMSPEASDEVVAFRDLGLPDAIVHRLESQGNICLALPEERLDSAHRRRDSNDSEPTGRREPRTERERRVIGRRINHNETHVAYVASQREAEQNNLHQGHQKQNRQRLAVAQNVAQLLDYESPKSGCHDALANLTNSSSMVGTFHFALSSRGLPIVTMRPSTMIEMRSQYSASSM